MTRFPRWLSLLILAFLGYMLYNSDFGAGKPLPEAPSASAKDAAPAPSAVERSYPALQSFADGNRWKRAIYPDYVDPNDACMPEKPAEGMVGNYAILLDAGSGDAVRCHETLKLDIAVADARGTFGKPREISLKLAEQKGLDALLVGMRPGEARLLVLTPGSYYKPLPFLAPKRLQLLRVKALPLTP